MSTARLFSRIPGNRETSDRRIRRRRIRHSLRLEALEVRQLMAADSLPSLSWEAMDDGPVTSQEALLVMEGLNQPDRPDLVTAPKDGHDATEDTRIAPNDVVPISPPEYDAVEISDANPGVEFEPLQDSAEREASSELDLGDDEDVEIVAGVVVTEESEGLGQHDASLAGGNSEFADTEVAQSEAGSSSSGPIDSETPPVATASSSAPSVSLSGATIQHVASRVISAYAVKAQAASDAAEQIASAAQQHAELLRTAESQRTQANATAEQQLRTTVVGIEKQAAGELAKLEARMRKTLTTAETAARKSLGNASNALKNRLDTLANWYKDRVEAAKSWSADAVKKATNEFDRISQSLRSWYNKTIKKLPSWMQRLSKYIGKYLSKLNSGLAEAKKSLQETTVRIQEGVESTLSNLGAQWNEAKNKAYKEYEKAKKDALDARDNLSSSAKKEYDKAARKARDARDKAVSSAVEAKDKLISGAQAAYSDAVKLADQQLQETRKQVVEQRDRLILQADKQIEAATERITEIRSQVVAGSQDVLAKVAEQLPAVSQDLIPTILDNLVERIREAGVKFDEQVLQHAVDILTNPVGETLDRLSDPLQDLRVLTSYVDETVFGGAFSEAWHQYVQDPALQALMEANLGAYLVRDFGSEHYQELGSERGSRFIYHVNGINTNKDSAVYQAEELSLHLNRPVRLIHNPTAGFAEDLGQSGLDKAWRPPLPQHNGTVKAVAGMLYYHANRGEDVSITAHSQGTIIVRNALLTLEALGYQDWIREQVRFVAAGTPLRDVELTMAQKLTVINNSRDPINTIARWEDVSISGVDASTGLNLEQHGFVESYMAQISNAMLWPSEPAMTDRTESQDGVSRDADLAAMKQAYDSAVDVLMEQIGSAA